MRYAPVPLLAIAAFAMLLCVGMLGVAVETGGGPMSGSGDFLDREPTTAIPLSSRADNLSLNNTPPVFLDFNVTPREGDTDTIFTFIVNVSDPDGDALSYVLVDLGYDMSFALQETGNTSTHTTFVLQKRITNGRFKVVFETKDARGAKNSTLGSAIDLLVKKFSKEETNYLKYLCIASIIATTLILMLITFRYFQQRRKALAKAEAGPQDARVTCSNCGKPIDENMNICPHCKEHLDGEEQICPFCKTKVPEGASRCPLCKKRFVREASAPKKKPTCPECGAVVDELKGPCPGCGKELDAKKGIVTPHGKKAEKKGDAYMCSQCGGEARDGDRKCPKCGVVFK